MPQNQQSQQRRDGFIKANTNLGVVSYLPDRRGVYTLRIEFPNGTIQCRFDGCTISGIEMILDGKRLEPRPDEAFNLLHVIHQLECDMVEDGLHPEYGNYRN